MSQNFNGCTYFLARNESTVRARVLRRLPSHLLYDRNVRSIPSLRCYFWLPSSSRRRRWGFQTFKQRQVSTLPSDTSITPSISQSSRQILTWTLSRNEPTPQKMHHSLSIMRRPSLLLLSNGCLISEWNSPDVEPLISRWMTNDLNCNYLTSLNLWLFHSTTNCSVDKVLFKDIRVCLPNTNYSQHPTLYSMCLKRNSFARKGLKVNLSSLSRCWSYSFF